MVAKTPALVPVPMAVKRDPHAGPVSEPFMPMPGVTFLSCVHEGLPDVQAAAQIEIGRVSILSGLKTMLETGAPLAGAPAAPIVRKLRICGAFVVSGLLIRLRSGRSTRRAGAES